jgi:diguanylate cyclase (GGDEF)-like protein
MLIAPLLGMLLYSIYIAYTYGEYKESSHTIASIQQSYLPILELAGNNILIFDVLAGNFKDAVMANEQEWVLNTRKDKELVERNLEKIKSYLPRIGYQKDLDSLALIFNQYYENAFSLSLAMMNNSLEAEKLNQVIENVETYHQQTSSAFENLKMEVQQELSDQIDKINHRLNQLILIGIGMGLIISVVVIGLTFKLSLSARHSLTEVKTALKNIAQDKPDFTARIIRHSNDELGEMVKWFNLLTEKLEKDYKKIELLSITDKLTQLHNRTKIDDLFEIELSRVKRYHGSLSLILVDLDHFKSVNDDFGHLVGDKVLKELASLLKSSVRSADHIGRWGGEEFLILSSDTNLEQACQHAEKLRLLVEQHEFSEVGHKTGSFGVATYHDGDDEDSMTKRADDCLYLAKDRGRNIVVTEDELENA